MKAVTTTRPVRWPCDPLAAFPRHDHQFAFPSGDDAEAAAGPTSD